MAVVCGMVGVKRGYTGRQVGVNMSVTKSQTWGKCVADLFEDSGGVRPILRLRSSPNPPPCVSNNFLKLTPARSAPFYWGSGRQCVMFGYHICDAPGTTSRISIAALPILTALGVSAEDAVAKRIGPGYFPA